MTEEEYQMIERCGKALTKPSELARIIGMDPDEVKAALSNPDSEIYEAFFKGFELTKLELRESTLSIASQGSSPAQTLAFQILKDVELEMEED